MAYKLKELHTIRSLNVTSVVLYLNSAGPARAYTSANQNIQSFWHFWKTRGLPLCLRAAYKTGVFSYRLSEEAGNSDEFFMCFLNSCLWIKRRQNAAYCHPGLCRDDMCNNSPGLSHHAAVKASQLPAPNGSGFPKRGGEFPVFLYQCDDEFWPYIFLFVCGGFCLVCLSIFPQFLGLPNCCLLLVCR